MNRALPVISLILALLLAASSICAQTKSNTDISRQIKHLNIDKNITVSFDGNTSKVMAIADNFTDKDSSRNGIQAMNFAIGFFYPGDQLKESPDPIMLTFWVLTKRPRFADIHNVTFNIDGEPILVENVRYAAKPREGVEYINCKLSRSDLAKITSGKDVKVQLGEGEFKFLPDQLRMMSDLLVISNTGGEY